MYARFEGGAYYFSNSVTKLQGSTGGVLGTLNQDGQYRTGVGTRGFVAPPLSGEPHYAEEPYTSSDRALLAAIAEQMGIVSENLSLQQRLFRQQEGARELQVRAADSGALRLQECPVCGRCFDFPERCCVDDGAELISAAPVLRVVDDRYRLHRVLGRGGMGIVYQASDLRLKRDVAIKLILPRKLHHAASLKRFVREAQALARISHPNIVATYDFGVIEGELAWMVMEFVQGSTLRAEINSGAIRPSRAASWLGQLLDGVQAAHEAGIVHRDLKPENILVSHPIDDRSRIFSNGNV